MKVLLDTNTCIYLIKREPREVLERLREFRISEVGISSITYAELCHGVFKSKKIDMNMTALDEFVLDLEIAKFDDNAARLYGEIKVLLEKSGQIIGPMDLLIGAHALSLGIPIITNNEREFKRVPGLEVQNWVKRSI